MATMEAIAAFAFSIFGLVASQQANLTDRSEVEALREIGSTIGLSPPWNFDVDPCSGTGGLSETNNSSNEFRRRSTIRCDCSTDSVCHVIRISIVSMNVRGQISPRIGSFPYLNNLNLQANLITGSIPDEIGLLSNLQYLTVASNRLSGPIPRSMGNLTQLLTLSIAVNNFSGSVPQELGSLTFLRELYMDSSGLGGELPRALGDMRSLQTLNMFDNNFNGTIPDFLVNISSLQNLAMYGNKFTGPIPSFLGNLTNLVSLELGEVSQGGSIPPSYNSLSSLTKLSLRNCQLSGSIPALENLTQLSELDLSFNNLSGSIPASLSSLPLQRLFLGSNNLTGTVPPELSNIVLLDVSFNELTGSLPSVSENSSVIGNDFSAANRSQSLPNAMTCLEGLSNCSSVNGGSNFQFAINCGGPAVVSDETTFDADTSSFLDGDYFSNRFWVSSSSGYAESFQSNPTWFESIDGTSGRETDLYRTAKTAPTSLRYLGVGMQSGSYTVHLHFAEIIIGNGQDGPGVGRRFFDVFIQGDRKIRDFNIREEAGGSLRALRRTFTGVNVSDGVLDIHLLWMGKGTCCAPFRSFGPLISAIDVQPEFQVNNLKSSENSSNGLKIGLGITVPLVLILAIAGCMIWRRQHRKQFEGREELKLLDGKLHIFSYNEIKNSTGGFDPQNMLGKGAFGRVYKGVLADGTVVAIKQLTRVNETTSEFVNEVTLISTVQHRNLVKLYGCCVEGDNRILVLEFMENNNLHQALFGPFGRKSHLSWPTRFNICVGVARGLAYLHEESSPRIIHRDIKATNVLLDDNLVPKIADFGLAKLFEDHQSHISTRVAGTMGYLAPEYALRGVLTEKADVYSFGILALEIVSGKTNLDSTREHSIYLLDSAWDMHQNNKLLKFLDKNAQDMDEDQAIRVIKVALLCSQVTATSRPSMSKVVAMLTGNDPIDVSSLLPGVFTFLDIVPQIRSKNKDHSSSSSNIGTDSPWEGSSSSNPGTTSSNAVKPR